MRIAMIVERFPPDIGGSSVRFFEIAKRLSRRHEIDVLTLGKQSAEDSILGFHVYRGNLGPGLFGNLKVHRILVQSLSCLSHMLMHSYDVVDVDFWPALPFFSVKMIRPQNAIVVTWNVAWPFSIYKPMSEFVTVLARMVSRSSTHNVTVSEFAQNNLSKNLRIDRTRLEVIPNGIADEFLKAKVSPQWGRMVFVGRLERQKRLDLVLQAFKMAKRRQDGLELHIIGSGPLYFQLLSASRRMKGLYLHGAISPANASELISELRKSWVFLTASEFETYGMAMAESLSIGLPVVLTNTSNNGAINGLAKHTQNSLIVRHDDPKAMADAIEELYNNEALWKKLSTNAKYGTVFYSWDDVAERTENAYARVSGMPM